MTLLGGKKYYDEEHRRWLVSMIPKCLAEAKNQKLKYNELLFRLYEKGFVCPYDDIDEVLFEAIRGNELVFWGFENDSQVFYLHKGKYDPEVEDTPPTPPFYLP